MRLNKRIIVAMLAVSLAVTGNSVVSSAASKPSATKKLTIVKGEKRGITIKGSFIKSKVFKSTNKKIAKVNKEGIVTAVSKGECKVKITVKYQKDKNSKKILEKKLVTNIKVNGKPAGETGKPAEPTAKPFPGGDANEAGKDENEVKALQNIIQEQRLLGATVGKDLNDTDQYTWTDGRLTGIDWSAKKLMGSISFECFPELSVLNLEYNELKELDITSNKALVKLNFGDNYSLDDSVIETILAEVELVELVCSNLNLKTLDVSKMKNLEKLDCSENQLTALDVSQNPVLTELSCGDNQLAALDVSQNPALTHLDCDNTKLTALDVSQNPALTVLLCGNNELTALDVSQNPALTMLGCYYNKLTALDLTNNTQLYDLSCDSAVELTGYSGSW